MVRQSGNHPRRVVTAPRRVVRLCPLQWVRHDRRRRLLPWNRPGHQPVRRLRGLRRGRSGRPAGALVFAHYGDRLGRRRALAAGILLMTLATARPSLWHRRHRGPERGAAWVGAAQLGMAAGVPARPAAGLIGPYRRCGSGLHDVQHLLRLPAELPGDYWAGPDPSSTCCRARRPGGRVDGRARLGAGLRSRRPPIGADRRCAGSAAADPTGRSRWSNAGRQVAFSSHTP